MSNNTSNGPWSVIPPTAKAIAAILFVGMASFAWFVPLRHDAEMTGWPLLGKIAFVCFISSMLAIYALLVGYVYGDAKVRGMRHVMWAWLAALVPNAVGIILYFILRDPQPKPCPKCSQAVPSNFVFCPHCGTPLAPRCSNCGKPMERDWANCAYCGVPASSGAATPAP